MRPLISRRCACCWSDDWRIAATAAFWNAASGFDSSAEENCLNSFSRDSLSSSATAPRTWCCTAVLDSEPKCRASTRVTCPLSGPKMSSSSLCSAVTTASEVCPSRLSTSLDACSRSCRRTSTLAPACSRSSTRAPISTASATTRAGSSPASERARTRSVAVASSTTTFSMISRPSRAVTRGERRGVAAASMAVQSQARPATRRNRSADVEAGEALGRLVRHVDRRDLGVAGAVAHERDHRVDSVGRPLEHAFDAAVAAVARPPGHPAPRSLAPHRIAEEHALDAPVGAHPAPHRALAHAEYRRPMAAVEVLDGDITTLEVDAIANAANTRLLHGGGVAGAISRAGGPSLQAESHEKAPIGLGEAVETAGGDMPCRWVIHAATMELGGPTSPDIIRRATRSTLERADALGARSLALVAFGTGV